MKKGLDSVRSIPGFATSSAKSGLILTLTTCQPEFENILGTSENPSRLDFGIPTYGQYVASSVMNHIIVLGVALAHFLMGVVFAIVGKTGIREGVTRVRCPSLTVIPVFAFLEPTCKGAVITIIFGEGGIKVVGVMSLLLCYGYVVALLVYLKKTWAAEFIPGENPGFPCSVRQRKQRRSLPNDDDADLNEIRRPGEETDGDRRFGSRFCSWLGYFVDGGVKWKDNDPEDNKGYCRRNRLLFMDFKGKWFWFLAVELGIAALCGTLDGIKLGPGKCDGIIVALILILIVYFVTIVKILPYNAPFLLLFTLILTLIQLVAAILMGASMFTGNSDCQEWAEILTLVGFYTIIARAFFDIAPKVRQMIFAIIKTLVPKRKKPVNQDLSRHLLHQMSENRSDAAALVNVDAGDNLEEEQQPLVDDNGVPLLPEVDWGDEFGGLEGDEIDLHDGCGFGYNAPQTVEEREEAEREMEQRRVVAVRTQAAKPGETSKERKSDANRLKTGDEVVEKMLDDLEKQDYQLRKQQEQRNKMIGGGMVSEEILLKSRAKTNLTAFCSAVGAKMPGAVAALPTVDEATLELPPLPPAPSTVVSPPAPPPPATAAASGAAIQPVAAMASAESLSLSDRSSGSSSSSSGSSSRSSSSSSSSSGDESLISLDLAEAAAGIGQGGGEVYFADI